MGSTAHGQLGNPQSDGKVPCLVHEKLVGEFVEEISFGAHYVVVLTSRSEVYTWGKGANGRLGHGDIEDCKSPTLVEALKDRHVKSISCGSNFTATICVHKWVSGADQSVCSGCRQAFGFTRERHNCYNCGLVHCHACSSKKAVRAALAPTPSKPHRVCDSCYNKLKATVAGNASIFHKRPTAPRRSIDSGKDRFDRTETMSSRILLSPNTEPVKYLEVKTQRLGTKSESVSMVRASQVPSFQQLKDIAFPSSFSAFQSAARPLAPMSPPKPPQFPSGSSSRPASPYSRRPSPPCSINHVFSRGVIDSLRKSNELLSQEVAKLQNHLKNLKHKCDFQDEEIQKLQKNAKEASIFAAERSSKFRVAREVVKSFTIQVNEIVEKTSPEVCDSDKFKAIQDQALAYLESSSNEAYESQTPLPIDLVPEQQNLQNEKYVVNKASSSKGHKIISLDPTVMGDPSQTGESVAHGVAKHGSEDRLQDSNGPTDQGTRNGVVQEPYLGMESGVRTPQASTSRESIQQFEPGVYSTFIQLHNGTKVFRRVRFSKRRFAEQQAEEWWKQNKDRLLRKYVPPPQTNNPSPATITLHAFPLPAEDESNELIS